MPLQVGTDNNNFMLGIFSFLLYKLSSRIDCRGTRLQSYLNIENNARAFKVFDLKNYLHE